LEVGRWTFSAGFSCSTLELLVRGILSLLAVGLISATLRAAEPIPTATVLPAPDPEREGRELAAKLRDSVPARESEFKGVLVVTTRDGKATEIPITSKITIRPTNWQVSYHAPPRGQTPGETLVITHSPEAPNRYQLDIGAGTSASSGISKVLSSEELARPFAGSDFGIIDLGLEFFHWPRQRKLKHEMRRSRSCNVLESINPNPAATSYARVVSWIDVETGGIIRAEAFDRSDGNRPVKEFELGSLRKVDGQHQLESMKIRSKKTGQETELKFDLETK
jgi:hypothetical protein